MGLLGNNYQKEENMQAKEVNIGSAKLIPLKIANKMTKAVCKIIIETKKGIIYGTGFFLNYSNSKKYLMTCYHVINPSFENYKIQLEIHNKKIFKLKFHNRFTKYIKEPEDIAIIEIKESDEIYKEVEYLYCDKNYIDIGYSMYKLQMYFQ